MVVVPASLAHLLAAFTQDSHDTIEEAESRAKFGNKPLNKFGETEKLAELLADKAEKGNTIIVPITDGKTGPCLSASRKAKRNQLPELQLRILWELQTKTEECKQRDYSFKTKIGLSLYKTKTASGKSDTMAH